MLCLLLMFLVGDLVSPLLHGLHGNLDDGGLLDLSDGGDGVGGGLGQTQAVAHGGWDIVGVLDSGGSRGHGRSEGSASSVASSVGVGQGSVEENLSLGSGGGKSKNNLRGYVIVRNCFTAQ